jgi:uncharacterized membrane protein
MIAKKKLMGIALATTAAITFAAVPATSALAAGKSSKIPCYGVNSCKGKSQCKTATSSCKGNNSCKGKGYMLKTKAQCKKLGGTTESH